MTAIGIIGISYGLFALLLGVAHLISIFGELNPKWGHLVLVALVPALVEGLISLIGLIAGSRFLLLMGLIAAPMSLIGGVIYHLFTDYDGYGPWLPTCLIMGATLLLIVVAIACFGQALSPVPVSEPYVETITSPVVGISFSTDRGSSSSSTRIIVSIRGEDGKVQQQTHLSGAVEQIIVPDDAPERFETVKRSQTLRDRLVPETTWVEGYTPDYRLYLHEGRYSPD